MIKKINNAGNPGRQHAKGTQGCLHRTHWPRCHHTQTISTGSDFVLVATRHGATHSLLFPFRMALLLGLGIACAALPALLLCYLLWRRNCTRLKRIPGPPLQGPLWKRLLFGNFDVWLLDRLFADQNNLIEKYGKVFYFSGFGQEPGVYVSDPNVLRDVLVDRPRAFPKCKTQVSSAMMSILRLWRCCIMLVIASRVRPALPCHSSCSPRPRV